MRLSSIKQLEVGNMLGIRPQRDLQFQPLETYEKYDIHGRLAETIYELKDIVDTLDSLADNLDFLMHRDSDTTLKPSVHQALSLASKVEDCKETMHMILSTLNYREFRGAK